MRMHEPRELIPPRMHELRELTPPILHLDDSEEAASARALLASRSVAFEVVPAEVPTVMLLWEGLVYEGVSGVADFLMAVGRTPHGDADKGHDDRDADAAREEQDGRLLGPALPF